MNKTEARDHEEKRQKLMAALKPAFPTIVSVLETSDERSRIDRAENQRKREKAFRKRVKQRAKR